MARGGYRPGGGRPKGSKDKKPRKPKGGAPRDQAKPKNSKTTSSPESDLHNKIKQLLEYGTKAKAKALNDLMNKQAEGIILSAAETKNMIMLERELSAEVDHGTESGVIPDGILTPLDYILKEINNPSADKDRKDKLAIAALPFCHDKISDGAGGKKKEAEEKAKKAASGLFAPSAPPVLKAVK